MDSHRGNEPVSLFRGSHVKALGNVELLGEDRREGHVHADHDDDRDWDSEVSESSTNLQIIGTHKVSLNRYINILVKTA